LSTPILRIGLYGGVFDPPHIAHQENIILVQKELQYNIFLVSVCHTPSHKHVPTASYEDQLFMTTCMVKDLQMKEVVVIGDKNLPQPSRTINMVYDIYDKYPDAMVEISLIIGSDEWNNFPKWERANELSQMCKEIIVIQRRGYKAVELDGFSCRLFHEHTENISSTLIKEYIEKEIDISGFINPTVLSYIKSRKLYNKNIS